MARRAKNACGSVRGTLFDRGALVSRKALCVLSGISERELAVWEREDLIVPVRTLDRGRRSEPLYDSASLRRVRLIRTLAEDLDVNLPGIEIILQLLDRMDR